MEKRQKDILKNFTIVIVITAIAVAAMTEFKNWVNRSEAMRAMEQLGRIALQYRKEQGCVPSESYVDNIKSSLEGSVRLGDIHYRARWLDFESPPDEILAYSLKGYHSLLFGQGYVVLRLNGQVEWMNTSEFETLLAKQQSPEEIQMLSH